MDGSLGELQIGIVKAVASSKDSLIINQLASILNRDKTTVFKSVDNLLQKKYLVAHQEYLHGRKYLKFTDKGAFVALEEAGVSFQTIIENHPYVKSPSFITHLWDFVEREFLNTQVNAIFAMVNAEPATFDADGKYHLDEPNLRGIEGMMMIQIIEGILKNMGPDRTSITNIAAMLDYLEEAKRIVTQRADELLNTVRNMLLKGGAQITDEKYVFEDAAVNLDSVDLDRLSANLKEKAKEK